MTILVVKSPAAWSITLKDETRDDITGALSTTVVSLTAQVVVLAFHDKLPFSFSLRHTRAALHYVSSVSHQRQINCGAKPKGCASLAITSYDCYNFVNRLFTIILHRACLIDAIIHDGSQLRI